MRSLSTKVPSAVGIAIEIRNRMRLQLFGVCLDPFCGAEESWFLAVPRGVDDGGLRPPALLVQRTKRARFLQFSYETRDRILRTIHPRVVVIPTNDPLVRLGGAGKFGDYIIECLEAPVRFYAEMDFSRPRAEPISDGKPAAPRSWSDRTSECSQQRLRIAVGNREHRYLGDSGSLRECEALRILCSSHSWRQRVSRIGGHILN